MVTTMVQVIPYMIPSVAILAQVLSDTNPCKKPIIGGSSQLHMALVILRQLLQDCMQCMGWSRCQSGSAEFLHTDQPQVPCIVAETSRSLRERFDTGRLSCQVQDLAFDRKRHPDKVEGHCGLGLSGAGQETSCQRGSS